jgi:predicted site-specific integrase-resolvase
MAFVKPLEIGSAAPGTLRAAQYVRVSTDPQKYSIENQAAAIAAYAARRNIGIVRTYSDVGRSTTESVSRRLCSAVSFILQDSRFSIGRLR